MQSFKITREELLKFAQRLYHEGVCGYLDLCEATTESMVAEFLDGRELLAPDLTISGSAGNSGSFTPWIGVGSSQSDSAPHLEATVTFTSPTSSQWSFTDAGRGIDPSIAENSTTVTGISTLQNSQVNSEESNGITISETPVVREEVLVRSENYVGNQSEIL